MKKDPHKPADADADPTGAADAAETGVNSVSPVGDPPGGPAVGNPSDYSPGEGVPEQKVEEAEE